MTIIKCRECGNSVSTKAVACPSCGAPVAKQKKGTSSLTSALIIGAFTGVVVFACSMANRKDGGGDASTPQQTANEASSQHETSETSNKAAQTDLRQLKPGQLVKFGPKKYACASKELLFEAAGYHSRNELTKFEAMFSPMTCLVIPAETEYKVLSVEHHAQFDIVEFAHPNSKQLSGMWTDYYTGDAGPASK